MKTKFLALILTAVALFSSLGYTYATETETETETSTEPIVVDVSESSIQAIASAVQEDENGNCYVINKNGDCHIVPTGSVLELWDEWTYHTVLYSSTEFLYAYIFSNEPVYYYSRSSQMAWSLDNEYYYTYDPSADYTEQEVAKSLPCTVATYYTTNSTDYDSSTIVWSDHDIYSLDRYGSLTTTVVYESDVVTSYLVSYVTGFDDLVIEDSTYPSENFVLPSPTKEGYSFLGWFYDDAYETPWDSPSTLTANVTLYAKWSEWPPMYVFTNYLFDGFTTVLACEPVMWCISLMALAVIVGIIKAFITSRV